MNVLLQRHGAKHIYVVPEGLRELMMDISREVLREQPKDIYTFCADYCDALMVTRENARVAASLVANLTDCSLTIADLLERTGMTRDEANHKVKIIQRAFRQYVAKTHPERLDHATEEHILEKILKSLDLSPEDANRAAKVIQRSYRDYKNRRLVFEEDMDFINWRTAMNRSLHIYRLSRVPNERIRRAASTIQAAYRGYYTRCYLKKARMDGISSGMKLRGVSGFPPEVQATFDNLGIDPMSKSVQVAATLIQRYVRKYLWRTRSARIVREIMDRIMTGAFVQCGLYRFKPPDHPCVWKDLIYYRESEFSIPEPAAEEDGEEDGAVGDAEKGAEGGAEEGVEEGAEKGDEEGAEKGAEGGAGEGDESEATSQKPENESKGE